MVSVIHSEKCINHQIHRHSNIVKSVYQIPTTCNYVLKASLSFFFLNIPSSQLHGRKLVEKFYPDGKKFITMFPDGTGNVLYPFYLG